MKTIAAVAHAPHSDFVLEEIDLDGPRDDEILVRIHGVGVCHTDLATRDQHLPLPLPAVLGHEGAGIVEAVGAAVTKVVPGDRVALTFRSCGVCEQCLRGEPAYCQQLNPLNFGCCRPDGSSTVHRNGKALTSNFFGQSSFAELALAYERNVVKVPEGVPLALMGPLGCGVQTGAGAIMRSLACRAGSSVLVLGGGSVGLSGVLGAVIQGCETIIVSEPQERRRALALTLGATHVIDPMNEDLVTAARAIRPQGVDYVLDTTARPDTVLAAINTMSVHGELGLVGVPSDPSVTITLPMFVEAKITIKWIIEGDSDPDQFIPQLIELYRAGRFPFDKLIHTYRLDQINEAVRHQHEGTIVKAVLLTAAAGVDSGSILSPR